MTQFSPNPDMLQQTAFRPLQQDAFQALQQSASLKGLLKPFKGKGELTQFADLCSALEAGLQALPKAYWNKPADIPSRCYRYALLNRTRPPGRDFFAGRKSRIAGWASASGPR